MAKRQANPSSDPAPASPRDVRRSRRRRRLRTLYAIVIGLGLGLVLVTKSGILRYVVLPQVESMLGCEASCGRVMFSFPDTLILRDFSVRIPSVDGPASEFLTATSVHLELALDSWWPGSARVRSMRLFDPVIRLSQAEDLTLNVSGLSPGGGVSSPRDRIPEVHIVNGILELGEHDRGGYVPLMRVLVKGGVEADPDSASTYVVKLTGDAQAVGSDPGSPSALASVDGVIDLDAESFQLTAQNINLTDLAARSANRSFRGYWEQLNLRGLIPGATITYAPDEGLAARFDVENVDLTIPVPVTHEEDVTGTPTSPSEDFLSMRNVTGEIAFNRRGLRAAMAGSVEDLTCAVTLQSDGLAMDAPLTCTIETEEFSIVKGQRPRILPFAPAFAQRIFRRFSSPGATLKGNVVIERGRVGQDQWTYSGAFELKDGEAQYEQFPYPFQRITASFVFDHTKFELLRISGVGPTGAQLLARGVIEPPGPEAEVTVDVTLVSLPMDEVFKESLPSRARDLYDLLFSDEAYAGLLERGLILAAAEASGLRERRVEVETRLAVLDAGGEPRAENEDADLRAELASIDGRLETPEFALGGTAGLNIKIHRPPGIETVYDSDIEFRLPSAGILPSAFPYPARATDVLIRMGGGDAKIESFSLVGLTGAAGTLDGSAVYPIDDEDGAFLPDLRIVAGDVPIDDLLTNAMPEGRPDGGDTLNASPRELLESLNMTGRVGCDARITSREDGSVAFHVDVGFDDLAAAPTDSLRFENVSGSLSASGDSLVVDRLNGDLGGRPFSLAIAARFGDLPPGHASLSGALSAEGLDLGEPFETILELAAPEQARALATLREQYKPAGSVDAHLSFRRVDDAFDYTLDARGFDRVEFDALGSRVHLRETSGVVTLDRRAARFESVETSVVEPDVPGPMRLSLDGTLARDEGTDARLDLSIAGGRFESPLVRAALERRGGAASRLTGFDPAGEFDLGATFSTHADARPDALEWTLSPRSLSFARGERRVRFESIEGAIAYGADRGVVRDLRLDAQGWSVEAAGEWGVGGAGPGEGGVYADLRGRLEATEIGESLVAALPESIARSVRAIELGVRDRLVVDEAHLVYAGEGAAEPLVAFDGRVDFDALDVRPGVAITDAHGSALVHFRRVGDEAEELDVEVTGRSLRVYGVEVTDARARITKGAHPDTHLIDRFEAYSNGGRITGRAAFADALRMNVDAPGRTYEIHAEATEVRFGPVLAQLKGEDEEESAVDRGVLDASFSLFGAFSNDATRRGRGTVRIEHGDVLNMPGIVPLLELSNLQAPAGEKVDLAFADFFVARDRLVFEDLYLYSPSIRIAGDGEIGWPSLDLDLRVQTRGMNQVPILSDILSTVREEFVATRITGTLYDPEFRYEQLSGAKRLFGTMLGGSGDER